MSFYINRIIYFPSQSVKHVLYRNLQVHNFHAYLLHMMIICAFANLSKNVHICENNEIRSVDVYVMWDLSNYVRHLYDYMKHVTNNGLREM